MSRREHPAGKSLTWASVTWVGSTALIELVNRHGRVVDFLIDGPEIGRRRARIRGNDKLALVYDVAPGRNLTILVNDDAQRILYDGTAPNED